MNTVLVIAVLLNGAIQVEAAYPMGSLVECEEVAGHQAVLDSYPGRAVFCWDGTTRMETTWRGAAARKAEEEARRRGR